MTIPQAAHLAHHNDIHDVVNEAPKKNTANTFTQPQSVTRIKVKENPWVDVTHPNFGAVGDGTTDDAVAIQAAVDAAYTGGGSVFFPPAVGFKINSSINLSGKRHMHLIGGRGPFDTGASFTKQPQTRINPASTVNPAINISGNAAGNSDNIVLENLSIRGGICGIYAGEMAQLTIRNCGIDSLTSNAHVNNAPLVLENSFWIWIDRCGFSSVINKHSIIARGKSPIINIGAVYLVRITESIFSSGGVLYEQNVTANAANWEFIGTMMENSRNPLMEIVKGAGVTFDTFWGITVDMFQHADPIVTPLAVIKLNSVGTLLQAVQMRLVDASGGATPIEIVNGDAYGVYLNSPRGARHVLTSGGVTVGNYMSAKDSGFDTIGSVAAGGNVNETAVSGNTGPTYRYALSGEAHARYSNEVDGKHRWGPGGATGGWDTELSRSAAGTLAVGADDCLRTGRAATGSRPSASTVGAGAVFFDTSLNSGAGMLIVSNGTNWVNPSTGATV
jgi:hypothetical protein